MDNKSKFETTKEHRDQFSKEVDEHASKTQSSLHKAAEEVESVRKHNLELIEEYVADPLDIGTTSDEA